MTSVPIAIVAIHGVAATPAVWAPLAELLPGLVTPQRPRTGRLADEVRWLAEVSEGAVVVGMSGGATLGLALAAQENSAAGFVLHEPAVGSHVPDLLAPMAKALRIGGTRAFARTLYGPAWRDDLLDGQSDELTTRETAMFRSFEPGPPHDLITPCVVTVGGDSPAPRQSAAEALARLGYDVRTIAGSGHLVTHAQPLLLAAVVSEVRSRAVAAGS